MSDTQPEMLANTTWGYNELQDGWCDIITFGEDSSYTYYSCELGDTIKGIYYFQKDTLVIEENADYPEGYIPTSNTCEYPERVKYIGYTDKDSLYLLRQYNWVKGRYVLKEDAFIKGIIYQGLDK